MDSSDKAAAFAEIARRFEQHPGDTLVLARSLRYHIEDRVLVCGNKTIVFR